MIYNKGEEHMDNPIPVTNENLGFNVPWEGHTSKEVESYICSVIEQLSETTAAKFTLTLLDGTLINFVDGVEEIYFKYKVKYFSSEEVFTTYRLSITVNGQIIQDNYQSSSEDEIITSPNLAQYLNATNDSTVIVRIRAYDLDENGNVIAQASNTITFNRVIGNLSLRAMSFGAVNPNGIKYIAYFVPTSAAPTAYLRYQITQSDGSLIQFTDSSTGEVKNYNDIVLNTAGQVTVTLPDNLSDGVHTITARLIVGQTQSVEGISTNSIIYNFLTVSDTVADGTPFIIVDSIDSPIQNDYTSVRYLVYVKGKEASYTTPLLLQDYSNNKYNTQAIKNVKNRTIYTWNYFVPNLTSLGMVTCQLRFALPKMQNGDIVYNAQGEPMIDGSAGTYKSISFTPKTSNISWNQIEDTFHLSARNKSNEDYDIGVLKDNGYEMNFEDFQWNTSGSGYNTLTIDGSSSNVLKFVGNSKATIKNFFPFYDTTPYNSANSIGGGILATGRTLKITFAVSNISNSELKVIDCYDESGPGCGFYVTGNGMYLKFVEELVSKPEEQQTTSGHNDRRFSENKRIELCITIQPYWGAGNVESAHEVRYYINGELAGFRKIAATTSLSQIVPKQITFGGKGAILYLYEVKYKNSCISPFEVLQEYGMSLDNSAILNGFYEKNNFYTLRTDANGVTYPEITLNDALNYGKYLASKGITDFAVFVTTNACNSERYTEKGGKANTKEYAQDAESLYIYRFRQNEKGEGEIDTELTLYIEGHDDNEEQTWYLGEEDGETKGALRFRRQGTSTADGTRGNLRWDTRATCLLHRFNPATQRFFDEYTKINKKWEGFYIPDKNAISCFLVTAKKNVNESTHTRNVPTAKWFESCSRALVKADAKYEDILTPPQRAELRSIEAVYPNLSRSQQIDRIKTRQVIDGITSLGFEIQYTKDAAGKYLTVTDPTLSTLKCEFIGQYDLTTDKKNMKIFGFGGHVEHNEDGSFDWIKDTDDEDFSLEFGNNTNPLSSFKSQNWGTDAARNDFEYRYPEDIDTIPGMSATEDEVPSIGMSLDGPMQALYDFVATCDPNKEEGIYYRNGGRFTGQLPLLNGGQNLIDPFTKNPISLGSSTDDTIANRNIKFYNELKYYGVVNQLLIYYIATVDVPLGVDQEAKNIFMGRYGDRTMKDGTAIDGDVARLGDKTNQILRILGYDYDTNLRLDNNNNFKFLYTVMYQDHLYDAGGSVLWDLIRKCFATEIAEMKSRLYGTLMSKSVTDNNGNITNGLLYYLFTKHIDNYNSIQYNANSEYCYTLKASDYPKSHGSAREDIEWFVEGRMRFMSGLNFNPDKNSNDTSSDFGKGRFYGTPSLPANLDDANYYNMLGYTKEEIGPNGTPLVPVVSKENRFAITVTGYERTNLAFAKGRPASTFNSTFIDVIPIVTNNIITGYTRPEVTLKAKEFYNPGISDAAVYLYGCKQIKTIKGLAKWYLETINSWGELTNVEELELGSLDEIELPDGTKMPYKNENLISLNLVADGKPVIFGSCKKLNLAGITNMTQVSLLEFPVLEVYEGRNMPGTSEVVHPVGNSLKEANYADNLNKWEIDNKPNLETITFQSIEDINTISVTKSSQTASTKAIDMLIELVNN